MRTFRVTRAWRYEGYEGGVEDSLILVDGQQIGGAYRCVYSPAGSAGWGRGNGTKSGESWASYGPNGYTFGHPTRKAAERIQVREYVTNPDLFDRVNAMDRAARAAEEAERAADAERRRAEHEAEERRQRLGDDDPGPAIWALPAYHALYAPLDETRLVSEWLAANDIGDLSAAHEVRVEQRAGRKAIVYEAVRLIAAGRTGAETDTKVITLSCEPPGIVTPARPDLHDLLEEHWPTRFPLIDFGQSMACGKCTRTAKATIPGQMILWPCPTVAAAIADLPVRTA